MRRVISILIIAVMFLLIVPTISFAAMGDYGGNITGATWYWPLHGYSSTSSAYAMITSSYGYRGGSYKGYHRGVDIGAGNGTAVYPTRKGTVSEIHNSTSDSYGRYVIINHNDGYFSVYMHLSRIDVVAGQSVGVNTQIGAVGGSGYNSETAYAYHLHMGIHYGNSFSFDCSVNPCPSGYTQIGDSLQESAGGKPIGIATISYSVNPEIEKPSAPTITSVSTVSTSSLKVKWNAVSGATAYKINRRRSGDEEYSTIVSSTTSTSYTDTGLLPGVKYYYRVYALNGSITSERSETVGAYTKPNVITSAKFSNITSSSLTISWDGVKSADYYEIYKRKPGESWSGLKPFATVSGTSYNDSGLSAGSKYYYRIYAVNESATSDDSESFDVYTKLVTPTLHGFSSITTSSLKITWNKVSGATSYDVYRRKSGESWSGLAPIKNVTTNYLNDSGLSAGTKYYYRVVAINDSTESAESESFGVHTGYNVSYNANGGSGAPSSQVKLQDANLTLSNTKPTRTGYSFVNWNTKADGSGTSYKAGASYTSNSAMTLYAQWTANKYTVTLNNQSATTTGTASVSATYGSAMPSITIPKKTGYTFGGYYTETNGSGIQYYKADGTSARSWNKTSATTLYAKWTASKYKVTFNANGGTTPIANKTVTYASNYGDLPKPTRAGYTFEGWYTSVSGGTQIKINTEVTIASAQTLYAQWTENIFNEEFTCVAETTYNGHRYQLFNDVVSWEYAKEYCERIGGHLVTISDEDENLMLTSFLNNHLSDKVTHYWIGATCSDNSENMQWVTGEPFEYINWNKNEPDNAGQYWMNITPQTGKWNDYLNRYATMGFICEFDMLSNNIGVTRKGNSYTINLNNEYIPCDCVVLVVGYKNNEMIDYDSVQGTTNATLSGDIDKIKVMVWKDMKTLVPLCEPVEILSSEFKTE